MKTLCLVLVWLLCSTVVDAIPRDAQQRHAFRKANPCPSTGKQSGACPGFQIDHTVALMNGGADDPSNMQWLPSHAHRAKTRSDFVQCRASTTCLYRKRTARHTAFENLER